MRNGDDMGASIARSLIKGCLLLMLVSGILATGLIYLIQWAYHEFF